MSTGFFAGFPGVSGRRDAPRYPPLSRGVDVRLLFVVDDVLKWLVKARAAERVGCAAGSVSRAAAKLGVSRAALRGIACLLARRCALARLSRWLLGDAAGHTGRAAKLASVTKTSGAA